MTGFLLRLVDQARGTESPEIRPRPVALFESHPGLRGAAFGDRTAELSHNDGGRVEAGARADTDTAMPPPSASRSEVRDGHYSTGAPPGDARSHEPSPMTMASVPLPARPQVVARPAERLARGQESVVDAIDGNGVTATPVSEPSAGLARRRNPRESARPPESRSERAEPLPLPAVRATPASPASADDAAEATKESAAPSAASHARVASERGRVRPARAVPAPLSRVDPAPADAYAAAADDVAPVVRVTIGRIDVRAITDAPRRPAAPKPGARSPRLGLEEYLGQRTRGER